MKLSYEAPGAITTFLHFFDNRIYNTFSNLSFCGMKISTFEKEMVKKHSSIWR